MVFRYNRIFFRKLVYLHLIILENLIFSFPLSIYPSNCLACIFLYKNSAYTYDILKRMYRCYFKYLLCNKKYHSFL